MFNPDLYKTRPDDTFQQKIDKMKAGILASDKVLEELEPFPWETERGEEFMPETPSKIQVYTGQTIDTEYKDLMTRYGNGLTTGVQEVDDFFTFIPQQLYLLSAPTHAGKTTLALNFVAKLASTDQPVLFASLEQGVFIAPRINSILRGGQTPKGLSVLTTTQLVTIKELTDYIKSSSIKYKLLCVDHLHFIQKSGNGVTQDIEEIVVELQNMAKELEIPVLVVAHVRKINENRKPTLNDLKDSVSLSQIPAVVMLINRHLDEDKGIYKNTGELIIAKNRIQGKSGILKFSLLDSGEFVFDTPNDQPQLDT